MKVYAIGTVYAGFKASDGTITRKSYSHGEAIECSAEEAKEMVNQGSASRKPPGGAQTVDAKELASSLSNREATDASRGGSPDDDDAAARDAGKTPEQISQEAADRGKGIVDGKEAGDGE